MDIFHQIGINATSVIQFALFAFVLIFLSRTVFGPYAHAAEERQKRTKGGEDLALEFQKKSIELHSEYELKTREVNNRIKEIVDATKSDANKQYEAVVASAREQSNGLIAENRSKISLAVELAVCELKSETATVAMTITNKLLGK